MINGVTKRVIMVNTPNPDYFDQVLFILNESAMNDRGVSSKQALDEAEEIARSYFRAIACARPKSRLRRLLFPLACAVGGAAATAVTAIIIQFI